MEDKSIIITAIICISLLECVALLMGFNGAILRIVLVVIAGLAGLAMPQLKLVGGGK